MAFDFEAIERIKRVKYAYCRAIDTCNLDLLASVFTPDATIDYHGGSYRFRASGRDEIVDAIKGAFHEDFVACHSVVHPEIDVHKDATADGRWRLLDYAMNLRQENLVTVGAADVVDRYAVFEGQWRIKSSAYTRLYERVFKEADPALTHYFLGGGHTAPQYSDTR